MWVELPKIAGSYGRRRLTLEVSSDSGVSARDVWDASGCRPWCNELGHDMAVRGWLDWCAVVLVVACGGEESRFKDASGAAGAGAGGGGGQSGSAGTAAGAAAGAVAGTSGATAGAGMAGSASGAVGTGGSAGTSGGSTTGGATGAGAGGADSGGAAMSGAGTAGSAGSVAGAGGAPIPTGNPVEEALPPLMAPRQEHGVAALRGEVYVIGGYAPSITASVVVYDPQTMTWRSVADYPTPLNHPNVGVVGDKLYVLGHYTATSMRDATTDSQVYDPDADAWSPVAPLAHERGAGCTAVFDDRIYVFGGGAGAVSVAYAAAYDPATDAWQELPDMPVAREHCVAATVNGKIYILGGRIDSILNFEPSSLEFDPAAPGYEEVKPIPTPRGGLAGGVLDGEVFLFGGEGNSAEPKGVFSDIDGYIPASDTWLKVGTMDVPRHGYGAAVIGDRIYLPGGADRQGGSAADDVSVFYLE